MILKANSYITLGWRGNTPTKIGLSLLEVNSTREIKHVASMNREEREGAQTRRTHKEKGLFTTWLFPQGRVKGGDEPPSKRPLGLAGGDEGEWPALRKILPILSPTSS